MTTAIAHTHHHISQSTNTDLINAIKNTNLPQTLPHLMTADSQTAGRGQHNRSWISPTGNVYLSLYIPMGNTPSTLHRLTGGLSLCVGLSLWQLPIIGQLNQLRTLHHLPPIQVKWANDLGLHLDNQALFQKLAGILIEPVLNDNKMVGIVIGVGLNIGNTPTLKDGLYSATSLTQLAHNLPIKIDNNPHQYYTPICSALLTAIDIHNRYTKNTGYGIVFDDDFIKQFNNAHALHHKKVAIFEQDDMTTPAHIGQCVGIDKDGTLLLKNNNIITNIFSGMARVID